jgi:prepilin-type N-terminal cleavage/methylation domain-containing protein
MRRQRGFSLIELLMAILVLTIVITTTLFVFTTRTSRLQQAAEIMLAYQALANEVELVRRVPYADIDALDDQFDSDLEILQSLPGMTTEVDVVLLRPGIKKVTLLVRWRTDKIANLIVLRSDTGGGNLW